MCFAVLINPSFPGFNTPRIEVHPQGEKWWDQFGLSPSLSALRAPEWDFK